MAGACPLVASCGCKDRSLKGAAAKVPAALEKAGVPAKRCILAFFDQHLRVGADASTGEHRGWAGRPPE